MRRTPLLFLSLLLLGTALIPQHVAAQGGRTLFGDVRITGENNNLVPREVTLILRRTPDGEIGRHAVL